MKKITLSFWFILLFVFYVAYQRVSQKLVVVSPKKSQNVSTVTSKNASPAPSFSKRPSSPPFVTRPKHVQPAPTPLPPPLPKSVGMYKDGEYTGGSVDAYYGNVQVKAIIRGGKITDVQFLDHPRNRETSQVVNSKAMPYLTQEAIQVQRAHVDVVSGATFTSEAFIQSLDSALAQAKK